MKKYQIVIWLAALVVGIVIGLFGIKGVPMGCYSLTLSLMSGICANVGIMG